MLFGLVFITLHSCKRDDQDPKKPNPDDHADHGFITSVELTLWDTAPGATPLVFVFSDADGPGGLPPDRMDSIGLSAGTNYLASIAFWDKSDPVKPQNLTDQILKEKTSHLVCYEVLDNAAASLAISTTDSDGKYPIGITSIWEAKSPIKSAVRVKLKHQVGVKNGSCIPGSTDVEVVFPLQIQ